MHVRCAIVGSRMTGASILAHCLKDGWMRAIKEGRNAGEARKPQPKPPKMTPNGLCYIVSPPTDDPTLCTVYGRPSVCPLPMSRQLHTVHRHVCPMLSVAAFEVLLRLARPQLPVILYRNPGEAKTDADQSDSEACPVWEGVIS